MTTFPDPLAWNCPMCQCSVIITTPVVRAYGEEQCRERLAAVRDGHIDTHANEFSIEMELAEL